MNFLTHVRALADRIEARLKEVPAIPGEVGRVAADELRQSGLHEIFDETDTARLLTTPGLLPAQIRPGLGKPSILLERRRSFNIRLEYRMPLMTVLHDHNFSGAYLVLKGSGLYADFAFATHERFPDGVRTGSLKFIRAQVLQRGDIERIAGTHVVCSLETPQINLRVKGPQDRSFNVSRYFSTGVAFFERRANEPSLQRALQMLDWIQAHERTETVFRFIGHVAENGEDRDLLACILRYGRSRSAEGPPLKLLDRLQEQHPRKWYPAVFRDRLYEEMTLDRHLAGCRNAQARLLCAMAIAVQNAAEMTRALRRSPSPVLQRFSALDGMRNLLAEHGVTAEFNESARDVAELLLEGCSDDEILFHLLDPEQAHLQGDLRASIQEIRSVFKKHPVGAGLLKPRPGSVHRDAAVSTGPVVSGVS